MSNLGHIKKLRSQKAKDLKRNHTAAFLILDTVSENAKRKMVEGHPLLELGEAIITAEECGLSSQEFETGLKYLENELMIEILHRGRKDKKSKLEPRITSRIKPESQVGNPQITSRINGTVVKLLDTECYDINIEYTPNHIPNHLGQEIEKPPNQTPNKQETRRNKEVVSCLKETSKEKGQHNLYYQDLPSVKPIVVNLSPSHEEKEEQMQTIEYYLDNKNILIERSVILRWLKKNSIEKIVKNINYMLSQKKKIDNPGGYLEIALKENYAQKEENRLINLKFVIEFKETKKITSLRINKNYCVDTETKNDYQYKIDPQTFKNELTIKYS